MTNGSRTRMEAREFWAKVQELRYQPARKRPPEGESCKTCSHYKAPKCKLKNKLVYHYNVCDHHKGSTVEGGSPLSLQGEVK